MTKFCKVYLVSFVFFKTKLMMNLIVVIFTFPHKIYSIETFQTTNTVEYSPQTTHAVSTQESLCGCVVLCIIVCKLLVCAVC